MPEVLFYLLIVFALAALAGVVLEELTHISKAKITLFFGTVSWILLIIFAPAGQERQAVLHGLTENITDIAGLWLFLIAAMTFVAYLNKKGLIENLVYLVLPSRISERGLLFLTGTFCFLFSSLADNITATLVSIALVLSLKLDRIRTIKFATLSVFAVNSGGVALITGDVTTLMIFLAGQVEIASLLLLSLPAFAAVMFLAAALSIGMSGVVHIQSHQTETRPVDLAIAGVFLLTILATISGNMLFQIPPVLTFLTGLSVMFLVARFFNEDNDNDPILEYIRTIEFENVIIFPRYTPARRHAEGNPCPGCAATDLRHNADRCRQFPDGDLIGHDRQRTLDSSPAEVRTDYDARSVDEPDLRGRSGWFFADHRFCSWHSGDEQGAWSDIFKLLALQPAAAGGLFDRLCWRVWSQSSGSILSWN